MRRIYGFIFACLIFLINFNYAHAEFDPSPDTSSIAPNSGVQNVVVSSSKVYVGGSFNLGTLPGHAFVSSFGAEVSASSGAPSASTPIVDGLITAVISDGSSGWYIGGSFANVGGTGHAGLAHILANGSVDSSFNPSINVGGQAISFSLSPDKATLYVGGIFTTINGTGRSDLAAVATSNGSLLSFDPEPDFQVNALALSSDGATLYAGGNFNNISGQAKAKLVALTTSNGQVVSAFNPGVAAEVNALALNSTNSKIYVGTQDANLLALNTNNGSQIYSDAIGFNSGQGQVFSVALTSDDSTLYVAGSFDTITGVGRNSIAAISASNGSLVSAFNPTNYGSGSISLTGLTVTSDGSTVYTAGNFSSLGMPTVVGVEAFSTADGSARSNFLVIASGEKVALSGDNSKLYIGGYGINIGGPTFTFAPIAFTASTKTLISGFAPYTSGQVSSQALSPDGATLYIGGFFKTVDNEIHFRLAALRTSDGSVISTFVPNVDDDVDSIIPSSDGTILYIGGKFLTVDSVTRNHVAAVHTSDGSLVTGFNPNADDFAPSLALSSDGTILYVGGDFLNIAGTARNRLAAVHTSDGSIVTGFNPNLTVPSGGGNGGSAGVRGLALSSDGSILYTAGQFTKVGGVTHNRLAAVHTSDGSIVSAFNPSVSNLVRNIVLNTTGSKIYATGQFTTVNSQSVPGLASVNTSDGSVNTSFTQSIIDAGVGLAIAPDNSKLYVGNGFNTLGSTYFAIFNDNSVPSNNPPTVTTQAASSLVATGATLNGNVTATGGINPATRGFVYGTALSYGATTTESGSFSTGAFSMSASGLICNTTYHYSAYATNTSGTGYGSDTTFVTSACATNGGGLILSSSGNNGGIYAQAPTIYFVTNTNFSHPVILTNYSLYDTGQDVLTLQKFLNVHGFILASSGAGAPGYETNFFGLKTYQALIKFQKSVGLPAYGFLGLQTRIAIVLQK